LNPIVSDTGPLLHLQEADSLDILQAAGRVIIPPGVHAELVDHDPFWDEHRPGWIAVEALEPKSAAIADHWLQAGLLDLGESEALSLAIQVKADWLLTDDAAARLIAEQQGLEVHGSLGVVLWAAVSGHLRHSEAERALEALFGSSLWVSPRVRDEARAALRQLFSSS
jgi:predicted nucleic acid-binding protein